MLTLKDSSSSSTLLGPLDFPFRRNSPSGVNRNSWDLLNTLKEPFSVTFTDACRSSTSILLYNNNTYVDLCPTPKRLNRSLISLFLTMWLSCCMLSSGKATTGEVLLGDDMSKNSFLGGIALPHSSIAHATMNLHCFLQSRSAPVYR